MKLVRLITGIDAALAFEFTVSGNFGVVTLSVPAETGRTKTQLAQYIVDQDELTGFVMDGTNCIGLVNDSFDNANFELIGEISVNEAISIGGYSVKKSLAFPAAAFAAGYILGR
jgi:hypothetical protein